MLELAVRAGLPLIAARTTDVRNFPRLIGFLLSKSAQEIKLGDVSHNEIRRGVNGDKLFWSTDKPKSAEKLVKALEALDSTVILLNQDAAPLEAFDVGEVPSPPAYVRGGLIDGDLDEKQVDEAMPGLGGLTLQEVWRVVRLCQAREGVLSLPGVLAVRKEAFSSLRGLQVIDTALPYYFPNAWVEKYLTWARPYLLGDHDQRLRPRGVLLTGLPGVGKTTAAKRMARVIGVPLLRLDLGAVKDKYVGESERVMTDVLHQVEREAPCVLVIDEVEKLFARTHDEGTTASLLASTLWWLSEHRARVLTVMTTNDVQAIPGELVRHGRLDETIRVEGLDETEAEVFAYDLAATFLEVTDEVSDLLVCAFPEELTKSLPQAGKVVLPRRVSHAELTSIVKGVVRLLLDG